MADFISNYLFGSPKIEKKTSKVVQSRPRGPKWSQEVPSGHTPRPTSSKSSHVLKTLSLFVFNSVLVWFRVQMALILCQHSAYSADVRERVCQLHADGRTYAEIAFMFRNRPCVQTIGVIVRSMYTNGGAIVVPHGREGCWRPGRRLGVVECTAVNRIMEVQIIHYHMLGLMC